MPEMSNREIDALCASKIFGWRHYLLGDRNEVHFMSPETIKSAYIQSLSPSEVSGGGNTINAPDYSTDPAASKQLRDKMRELGFTWELRYDPAVSDGPYVFVLFGPNCVGCWKAYADTEEMAVALAALKAVGVQQEEE